MCAAYCSCSPYIEKNVKTYIYIYYFICNIHHIYILYILRIAYIYIYICPDIRTECTVCIVCTVCTACTVCTVSRSVYTICVQEGIISKYRVPSTWYLVCIHMHSYASVCSHMHSYASVMHPSCIRMHPHASMQLLYASKCQHSTHIFAEKPHKQQMIKNASKFELQSVASNRSESTQIYKIG